MSNQTNKLTDEHLRQRAELLRSQYTGSLDTLHYVYDAEVIDELLAARAELEEYRKASKEPVAWRCNSGTFSDLHVVTLSRTVADSWIGKQREITPLYTAPPQAVTVPDEIEPDDGNTFDYVDGWNACRAAMLQAGNHTEQHLDMVNHSGDINKKVVTQNQKSMTCNSPVIPDGYALVPIEPTAAMYDAGDRQLDTKRVWDAMLAAAPQPSDK